MQRPTGQVRFTSIIKIITIIAILSSILIAIAKIVTIYRHHNHESSSPKSHQVPNFETRSQKCHQAVFLVGNIAGSLIAFLAFVAFLNGVLSW